MIERSGSELSPFSQEVPLESSVPRRPIASTVGTDAVPAHLFTGAEGAGASVKAAPRDPSRRQKLRRSIILPPPG